MLMSPYNRSLWPLIFIVHLKHFTSIIIHFFQCLNYFFWLKEVDAFSLIGLVLSVIKLAVDFQETNKAVHFHSSLEKTVGGVTVIYQWLNF